jgi:hypothetical protein
MANPNYKLEKNLLSDGDLKKAARFTRKLHTFYMQNQMMILTLWSHFSRGSMHG